MAKLQGTLLRLFVLFLTSLARGNSNPYLLKPFPVWGAVGNNVTIYCQVNTTYTTRKVYWALPNDEGAIGPNVNTNGNYDRHRFIGDPFKGFYNLQIRDVTQRDEGNYSCIFTNDSPGDTITLEQVAFLNVTTGKSDTELTCQNSQNLLFRDSTMLPNFSCSANGGVPLADGQELGWYMQLRNNSLIKVQSVTTVDSTGSGSVTASMLSDQFILSGHHDNSYLICAAGQLGAPNTQFCTTPNNAGNIGVNNNRIRVMYEPLVGFLPSRIEVGMFEQFELELKCFADSNPPLSGHPTIQLGDINLSEDGMNVTGNDSLVEGRLFRRVRIAISRGDVGRKINCTASNENNDTTVISIEIESLGGVPAWFLFVIIFLVGFLAFFILILCLCCLCGCDLEQERKRTERRRRTFRDSKVNGMLSRQDDDDFHDLDLRTYDNPPAMMPESPHDSGNYAESDAASEGLVNDFKIEEPDGETHHVQITSDQEYDDDDDDPPKKEDYLQVTIADDTAGEELELEELSRDRSPSLNEL